jgi:hypothetical protein
MELDLVELQRSYSQLDTIVLLRLSKSGEFVPEVQRLLDQELARRSDQEIAAEFQKVTDSAALKMAQGKGSIEVSQDLVKDGLAHGAAADIIHSAESISAETKKRDAIGTLASGLGLLALGIGVTVISQTSAENTGGFSLVWHGAVFVGIVQSCRGIRGLFAVWRAQRNG